MIDPQCTMGVPNLADDWVGVPTFPESWVISRVYLWWRLLSNILLQVIHSFFLTPTCRSLLWSIFGYHYFHYGS